MSNDSLDDDHPDEPTPVDDVYRSSPIAHAVARLDIHSKRLGRLREFQIVTEGVNGKNGKLSVLRAEVDSFKKLAISLIVTVITALGGVVGVAWRSASETGRRDAVIDQLAAEVKVQAATIESLRATVWSALIRPSPGATP